MVQIKIKAVNNQYVVTCAYDDFPLFLTTLKERLNACVKSHNGTFEAFFHIAQDIDEEQLAQVILCANETNTIVAGFAQSENKKRDLMILEQDLYSGQTYTFDREVLLLGSISAEAFVHSSENIYCIGSVSGNVDLLHEDCIICASGFFQANIRICDSKYHNLTSFSPAKVYYKGRSVECIEYKEERMWAVQ